MSVVEAIGVVSGILGIIQFAADNFGDTTEPGSTVKVAVALDGEAGGTSNAGGDLPDVRVWNEFGDFLAITSDPGTLSDGTVGTVEVDHEQQGSYSLFSANDDAICIAWVTTTWSEAAGGNKFAVSGDYGAECGANWYESHMWTNTDQSYQPRCFWIDANGDQPQTGFQVHWPAYSSTAFDEGNTDPTKFCNDIDFGLRTEGDPSTINFWTSAKSKSKARRSEKNERRVRARRSGQRVSWAAEQLVISDSVHHSARRLCDSETSMGPDFAHTGERRFCDMGAKVLYPFCGGGWNSTSSCFDLNAQRLIGNGLESRDSASPYTTVRDWRSKSS
ncbi:uncharacterized protein BJX67DRAFT_370502 [Aspergillus lucknowensis]|uniref:Uncharacterized protein n=1 Tax=Aspergillus lucknowensis TaxID=176173 RepID=A0ABR4M018_9EURO